MKLAGISISIILTQTQRQGVSMKIIFKAGLFILLLSWVTNTHAQVTFSISPTSLTFGEVQLNETVAIPLTLTNLGAEAIEVTGEISGDPGFTFDGESDVSLVIEPGMSDSSVFVSFTPVQLGSVLASVDFTMPGANPSSLTLLATGFGFETIGNDALISYPDALSFGTLPVGITEDEYLFLVNTTDSTLSLDLSTLGAEFSLLTPAQVNLPPENQAGEEGNVTVVFNPQSPGSFSGFLVVEMPGTSYEPLRVPLSGFAQDGTSGPVLQLSAEVIDYGPIEVGEAETVPVYLMNPGTEDVLVSVSSEGLDIRLDGPSVLSIPAGSMDSSNVVYVTAAPTLPNDFGGVVWFASNDLIEPLQYIEVIGYGTIDGQGGGVDLFSLLTPANEDTVRSLPLDFSWEAYPTNQDEAVLYDLILKGVDESDSTIVDIVVPAGADTSISLGSDVLVDGIGYSWHVVATVSAGGFSDWVPSDEHFKFYLDWTSINNLSVQPGGWTAPTVEQFALESIYPNPFNSSTTIRLNIPYSNQVKVIVYDILGREIIRLAEGLTEPGIHTLTWSPNGSAGVYFLRIESNAGNAITRKLVYMK
ncbi:choice-of-anchor D domain-containing protein [bacterium]|nr:choice-of-anchor D domain-containing protein [bacterium]